jgi:hypothetical protein
MDQLSIGERWAQGLQPADEREALIEVVIFHNSFNSDKYPPDSELDDIERKFCASRESFQLVIERLAVDTIDSYLSRTPIPWTPGMWKPKIPYFVLLPAGWRAVFGCEGGCGRGGLEYHHLHYRTVGCERPSDLKLLCRSCHESQHRFRGRFYANPEEIPVAQKDYARSVGVHWPGHCPT